jgi:hypothetical protein
VGPKESEAARYQIEENYGDISSDTFTLSNRAFKVALIQSTEQLTVQNPFTDNGGKPVSGYLDMVGAANDYQGRDLIFGFEKAPARNSASEAVRRVDLIDRDNNQGGCLFPLGNEVGVVYEGDFVSVRYAAGNSSANRSITDEELEVLKPKNAGAGAWDPFEKPGEPPEPENLVTAGTADSLAGQLLILQAYGSSSDAAGISHSFVELYNNTDAAIDLNGIGLYYADGTSVSNAQAPNTATSDGNWKRISLEGKSIPSKGSFLILSSKQSPTAARYQIPDNSGDINDAAFTLSNRAFKVALIRNAQTLTAQNPFDMGSGAKAEGYIDMVGAANEYKSRDLIFGFEGAPARNSASVSVRRKNITDTNNNSTDFESLDYRVWSASNPDRMSNELLEVRKPRNSSADNWDPFATPAPPPPPTEGLMIFQANTHGNNNGLPNSSTGGGFAKSLVEIYNNTDNAIDLSPYYLHIGNSSRPDGTWINTWDAVIKLSGTIPSKGSFLIVSNNADNSNATPRASLPVADQEADFVLGNDGFKVVLMFNHSATLTVENPFTAGTDDAPITGYIDMLGAGNARIAGFETAIAGQSRPQCPRRTSLVDSNNNSTDFAQADYRGRTGNNGVDNDQLYKLWPRNSAAGAWNPITGLPALHPTVVPANP